jgi:predicted nucleotidyltransferase
MVSKKSSKKTKKSKSIKKSHTKKKHIKHSSAKKTHEPTSPPVKIPKVPSATRRTLSLINEREIAVDFAGKVYKEFDSLVKSVILFGSSAKQEATEKSDIDIIIILDDVSVKFDDELIAWYRKNLGRITAKNKYIKPLHINSVKLSTWWQDLMRGDPVVVNVLRYGDALIDFGGFFNPLKILLKEGKIKSTPEAIYTLLERAPTHLRRARLATLAVIDGFYWCMVDAAHAALISADVLPPSPEKVPDFLIQYFVKNKLLHKKYVDNYREIHTVAKEIVHGKRVEVSGKYTDEWFVKVDDFLREMAKLVEDLIRAKK